MNGSDKKLLHLICAITFLAFAGWSCVPNAIAQNKPANNSAKSAECNAYAGRLHSKIDSCWEYPEGSNFVTLTTLVNADGTTGDVRMSSNPSNTTAEQAANEAFVKSLPLEPLPKVAGNSASLIVEFRSTSNLHGDSDGTVSIRLTPGK